MANSKNTRTIAVTAYKLLLTMNKAVTVDHIYDRMIKDGLYNFGSRSKRGDSRQKDIGILALSIKRHMANSKRYDKYDCMLFQSEDGLAHKSSNVRAIKTAKGYIIKLAEMLRE